MNDVDPNNHQRLMDHLDSIIDEASMTEFLMDHLESIIDKASMTEVLSAMEEVAYLKSEHVRTHWQDKSLADQWYTIARIIGKAANAADGV